MSSFPDEDFYLLSPPLNLLLLLLGLAYSCFYFLLRWCSFASPPSCSSSSLLLLFLHARASPPMARLLLLPFGGLEGTYLRLLLPPPPFSCSIALARSCFSSDSTPSAADGWHSQEQHAVALQSPRRFQPNPIQSGRQHAPPATPSRLALDPF